MAAVNGTSTAETSQYDLVIVGGGINGTGIARDAAGRGLKVLLCEQGDLACATSSASSKLIHGGLRYLEYYEFRLVREALREREVLLANAPHLIKPMRFRLPHAPHLRPAWMIWAGLFLYDRLAERKTLSGGCRLKLNNQSPLRDRFTQAFEYSDCWVDDARLVIANALSVRELGGRILPRTRCLSATRGEQGWEITLQGQDSAQTLTVHSKGLINATGPWVSSFIEQGLRREPEYDIQMIQGSHIVVPALYTGEEAYILQNSDKRIVFVIPWLGQWTLIGTTDVEHSGDPAEAAISQQEENYLIDIINQHFQNQISSADIVHSFAGVRPLCHDESDHPAAMTRDYTLTISESDEQFPLLNVFGGKLTTYRKLAESALLKLAPWFSQMQQPWTNSRPLPGGDIISRAAFAEELKQTYPWLHVSLASRYSESYGTLCHHFLADCQSLTDLGQHFGCSLYQREVDYLIDQEWAVDIEDILWRRSKIGLTLTDYARRQALDRYILNRS